MRNRGSAYARTRITDYAGNFTRDRVTNFAGNFVGNYARNYAGDFVGNYTRGFAGEYAGNYTGEYARTSTRTRYSAYVTTRVLMEAILEIIDGGDASPDEDITTTE